MNRRHLSMLLLLIVLIIVTAMPMSASTTAAQGTRAPFKLIGYYTYYSIYEPAYFVTDVPVNLLTHLIYSAINVSEQGQCVSADEWADRQFSYPGDRQTERLRGNFKQLQRLRKDNPNMRILMSIGGWDFSKYLSNVAFDQQARVRFVRSCMNFMREYGFDGIDIDWRFPVKGGKEGNISRQEDLDNYILLLDDFRGQIDFWTGRDGRMYELSITAPAVSTLYNNFKLDELATRVDWINLMAYSFQGVWSELASHHAPLFGSSRDPRGEDVRRNYNVDGAVRAFLDKGIPASKIVVGVPLFGQAWRITRPNEYFGLYQQAQGIPTGTRPGGILHYRDLVPLLNGTTFTRFFDEETQASWLYNQERRTVISYEDAASIRAKAIYVRQLNLGGMMLWELSFDDADHTLLKAANAALLQ